MKPHTYWIDALVGWFGAGSLAGPKGTWGSLASLPFAVLLFYSGGGFTLFIASIILFFIGVLVCDSYVQRTQTKDPSFAVIDEVAGQWIALTSLTHINFVGIAIGFVLFRFFDITKIQPAKKAEALEGGLGIMADDMIAGIYSAACLYFLQIAFPALFAF